MMYIESYSVDFVTQHGVQRDVHLRIDLVMDREDYSQLDIQGLSSNWCSVGIINDTLALLKTIQKYNVDPTQLRDYIDTLYVTNYLDDNKGDGQ